MKMRSALLVAMCGTALAAGRASAQQQEGKVLGAAVEVGATATDNRDSTPDGKSNTDIFARARLSALLDWQTAVLNLYVAPGFRYRTDPSSIQNDTEFHITGNADFKAALTPTTAFRADENLAYTDDPQIDAGNVITRRDSTFIANRVSAGIRQDLTQTANVDLYGWNQIKRYDEETVARISDQDQTGGELTGRLMLSDTLAGTAMVGAEMYDTKDYYNLQRGFDTYYGGLGAEQAFTQTILVNGMVGVQQATYEDDQIDDMTSPMARVGIKAQVAQNAYLTGQIRHQLDNAYSYPFVATKHTSAFAKFDLQATKMLGFGLFGEYRLEDYDSDMVSPSAPAEAFLKDRSGQETTILAMASASLNLTQTTKVTLSQLYEDVDSDVLVSFTRNATTLSLIQDF